MGKRSNKNRDVDINAEDAKKYGWAVETAHRLAELGFLHYASPQRSKHEYDGVLGELPTWFPHGSRGDFLIFRDRVLDHHAGPTSQTAKGWILAWEEDRMDVVNQIPLDLHHEIHMLSRFYRAYRLGPGKGLNLLLGKNEAKALAEGKVRERARHIGGDVRGEQKQQQGAKTEQRVDELERALRKNGIPPHELTKRIAKSLNLHPDTVRKLRKKRT